MNIDFNEFKDSFNNTQKINTSRSDASSTIENIENACIKMYNDNDYIKLFKMSPFEMGRLKDLKVFIQTEDIAQFLDKKYDIKPEIFYNLIKSPFLSFDEKS